ncbi:MAG: glycosyltransferase family 39 protein [Planctomycetota bacterium]
MAEAQPDIAAGSTVRPPPLPWRAIAAGIALTAILRTIWALAVPFEPVSDSGAYFAFASNIVAGGGYGWEPNEPSAYWAVGPAAIYAAAFALLGPGKLAVVLTNIVAATLCTAAATTIADRWFGRRHAWVAAALFSVWPTMIMFTTALNSEQLFATLLLLTLVVIDPMRPHAWARSAWAGPLAAVMALVRPTGLLIPAAVAGTRFLRGRGFVKPIAAGLLTTGIMLACIAPWTVRNYNVFGEVVLISTNGGPNFWMGNNPKTNGRYTPLPDDAVDLPEPERATVLKARALEYIKAEPLAFATRTASKFVMQHATETIGVVWNEPALTNRFGAWIIKPLKAVSTGFWLATLAGAAAGMAMLAWKKGLWSAVTHPAFLLWGYFATVHAITVIQDRYHLQWSPMVMLLATLPIVAAWSKLRPSEPGAS